MSITAQIPFKSKSGEIIFSITPDQNEIAITTKLNPGETSLNVNSKEFIEFLNFLHKVFDAPTTNFKSLLDQLKETNRYKEITPRSFRLYL